MKIRLLVIFALLGLVLGGCAAEGIPVENGTILAVIDDDLTRTSVSDSGVFTWSEGDQVWLQTTSGSVVGTLSAGAGGANATFSYGSIIGGELTGKSVYPYNSGHVINDDVLSVVLPASYELGEVLSNTNAAMYGVAVNGTLKFNHLAGVMRFAFKNVPAGVNKFTLTLDKKINGSFDSDLTADYPIVETESTDVASEKITSLYFDTLTSLSNINLYVPVPIGRYDTLELALYAGEQQVWTYSNTVTNIIARKTLKLMPVVTLGGDINGDIEGDGDEDPDFGDEDPDFGDKHLDMDILMGLRDELENNASTLEDHLALINDRLIALQADRDADAQALQYKQESLSVLQAESQSYQEMIYDWLQREVIYLESSLYSFNDGIAYCQSYFQSIYTEHDYCMAALDIYKIEYGESSDRIVEIETRLQALSVEIQEAYDAIVSLTSLLNKLEDDVNKLYRNPFTRSSTGANTSDVERQESNVATKASGDSDLQNLEARVEQIADVLETLMAGIEDCAEYAAKMEKQIQTDENTMLEYKAEYDQYLAQIEAIESELPELWQTVQIKNQLIEDINQKYLYYQDVLSGLSYQFLIYKVDMIELLYLINDGPHTKEEMQSLMQKYNKLKNDMEAKLEEIKAAIEVLSNMFNNLPS